MNALQNSIAKYDHVLKMQPFRVSALSYWGYYPFDRGHMKFSLLLPQCSRSKLDDTSGSEASTDIIGSWKYGVHSIKMDQILNQDQPNRTCR